jgi:ArsR family transcriptional regulator, arsenate/arsenite/antimonite-responsive transcriptional repressor
MNSQESVVALAALAQGTRLAVFRLLVQQGPSGMAAGEIAAVLGASPATLSFHLKELLHAGLVSARQDGRFVYYAADFARMNALIGFLTENCCAADCGPACGPNFAEPAGKLAACAPAGSRPAVSSQHVRRKVKP